MKIRQKTAKEMKKDYLAVNESNHLRIIQDDLYNGLSYPEKLRIAKRLEKARDIYEKDGILIIRITENEIGALNNSSEKISSIKNRDNERKGLLK